MNRTSLIAALGLVLALGLAAVPTRAAEDTTLDLDQLLQEVKQGRVRDAATNRQRVAEFRKEKLSQQQRLEELANEERRLEEISRAHEAQFEENDLLIGELEERLGERLGSLKELFGVLQQVAGDAQGKFATSLTQIHNPTRVEELVAFATRMGQTADLPTLEEIERLWYELQWEMTQSGKVVRTNMSVLNSQGEERQQEVIRVGSFNLISDGKYYQYVPETGRVVEFARQPAARYMDGAGEIGSAGDSVNFSIDPTRGQLLALLVQAPDLRGRIAQGGVIGYLIISLGIVALLLAAWRMIALIGIDRSVQKQLANMEEPGNNPLGRVLAVYQSSSDRDTEALELKLGEAVLREIPRVNRGLGFLKIVAAVAPLMGLLGTVTGMIITFQAITLFGAGDPKLMAGGISQALVTTVLGLTVAIPTLLVHQLVHSRAKRVSELLEQEAVALVALQAGD
ncbi:MAG: MotA/TolQ/ExbB proton channel family protein [Halioglobus sp.]|nr:MotA/TolQ/ExbB proton channel family protein [Halioglobus sp.]